MSLPPSGWQPPKVVWVPPDPVGDSDFERIEGNINMLGRLVPWYMVPSESVVVVESLGEVRSAVRVFNDDGVASYSYAIARKTFSLINPGLYRVTGQFRVSSAGNTARVLGVSTTSTGYVNFQVDVSVTGINSLLEIDLDVSTASAIDNRIYYAYMRNVQIKAVPATVLPADKFVSQVSY